MKTNLILILFLGIFVVMSCESTSQYKQGVPIDKTKTYTSGIKVTTIDSCQYLIMETGLRNTATYTFFMIHKANCNNPIHKYKCN